MITRMSHATIYVLDQDSAKAFYTEKLGFEVRMDAMLEGGFRWLTVGPQGQKDLEIVLFGVRADSMFDEATVASLRALVADGKMASAVFATDDCVAAHAAMTAKGVTFLSEPTERFYGVEAMFVDDSGNVFSLTERRG